MAEPGLILVTGAGGGVGGVAEQVTGRPGEFVARQSDLFAV